jgi:hypothetical protein
MKFAFLRFCEVHIHPHSALWVGSDRFLGPRILSRAARMASEGRIASVLKRELLNFKVKINIATGHDSYEAWRGGTTTTWCSPWPWPVGPGKGILGGGWG